MRFLFSELQNLYSNSDNDNFDQLVSFGGKCVKGFGFDSCYLGIKLEV